VHLIQTRKAQGSQPWLAVRHGPRPAGQDRRNPLSEELRKLATPDANRSQLKSEEESIEFTSALIACAAWVSFDQWLAKVWTAVFTGWK